MDFQKNSLNRFFVNIKNLFKEFFPITSLNGKGSIELLKSKFKKLKKEDCTNISDENTSLSLVLLLKVSLYDDNRKLIFRRIIKKSVINLPAFSKSGSFVINNIERTVVFYLKRNPGLVFSKKKNSFFLKVIPQKGPWIEFTFDKSKLINFRINKGKKLNIFSLFSSYGGKISDISDIFNLSIKVRLENQNMLFHVSSKTFNFLKKKYDLYSPDGVLVYNKNTNLEKCKLNKIIGLFLIIPGFKEKLIIYKDFKINNIKFKRGDILNILKLKIASNRKIFDIEVFNPFSSNLGNMILKTLEKFNNTNTNYNRIVLMESYCNKKKNEVKLVKKFEEIFLNKTNYSLSKSLREKINNEVGNNECTDENILQKNDILNLLRYFLESITSNKSSSDIDDLGNKSVWGVGEILLDIVSSKLVYFKSFLLSMLNITYLKKSSWGKIDYFSPYIREFFCTSQFSQFLDKNNDLSEITHKRRIMLTSSCSSSKLRNTSIRDIHLSTYGKICPIETPEGQNIGLVNSLAIFSKLDSNLKITSPYLRIINNVVSYKRIYYLNSEQEKNFIISKADQEAYNMLKSSRKKGTFSFLNKESSDFRSLSSLQLFSIAPLFVPFMENDDANRALMAANMQRQALPCIKKQEPFVSTGLEPIPSLDLCHLNKVKHVRNIKYIDSSLIIEKVSFKGVELFRIINLNKFSVSNQGNVINYKVINPEVFNFKKRIVNDSNSTLRGNISLGQNLLVAFVPFYGYNFEDSIIISQKVAESDNFCSIHSSEYSVSLTDTEFGKEFINKSIFLEDKKNQYLDDIGIVRVGSIVKSNDVLVAKVTPINKLKIKPEDKLLSAVFNNKANLFKDTCVRYKDITKGTVVEVKKIYSDCENNSVNKNETSFRRKMLVSLILKNSIRILCSKYKLIINRDFYVLNSKIMTRKNVKSNNSLLFIFIINNRISSLRRTDSIINNKNRLKEVVIKIFTKKRIEIGDKISGRHGNKGVISKILPIEDMPFTSNGTPCEVILNPLGIPSRMNIGQILEVSLGFIIYIIKSEYKNNIPRSLFKKLKEKFNLEISNETKNGVLFKSPPFSGFKYNDLEELYRIVITERIKKKYLITEDKLKMFNGMTGEPFIEPIFFGYMYILKLNHLVSDKIHARSIGPYSLITQQPLKGRANFGGQRFGEMEVWALEAYGASYTLQEMITIKSDDLKNRNNVYSSIFFDKKNFKTNVPESFNTLVSELRSLMIEIKRND
ncbi:DNA-directed RNA polymerase subunit beta [Candidatus Vidania fulgoroideorum]